MAAHNFLARPLRSAFSYSCGGLLASATLPPLLLKAGFIATPSILQASLLAGTGIFFHFFFSSFLFFYYYYSIDPIFLNAEPQDQQGQYTY